MKPLREYGVKGRSGNWGHAGRPGQVGGSADDAAPAAAPQGDLRPGWTELRDASLSGEKTDKAGVFVQYPMWSGQAGGSGLLFYDGRARKIVADQIAFLDGCSDAELLDLALEAKRRQEAGEAGMTDRVKNLLVSRMSPEAAQALYDDIAAKPSAWSPYDKKSGQEYYEWYRSMNPVREEMEWVTAMCDFGPTAAFREKISALRPGRYAGYGWGGLPVQDDPEANIKEFVVGGWMVASDTARALWVQAAAAAEFGNAKDETTVFWQAGHLGIRLRDPDPRLRMALRWLYDRTQATFKPNAKPLHLYRGVGSEVTVRSAAESWSALISTAKKYGNYEVFTADVPAKAILGTYQTIPGWWPEAQLHGKREHIVLTDLLPQLHEAGFTEYGVKGKSGHWGHVGIKGHRGGSAPPGSYVPPQYPGAHLGKPYMKLADTQRDQAQARIDQEMNQLAVQMNSPSTSVAGKRDVAEQLAEALKDDPDFQRLVDEIHRRHKIFSHKIQYKPNETDEERAARRRREEAVQKLISKWAWTSADTDDLACRMQLVAMAEFDLGQDVKEFIRRYPATEGTWEGPNTYIGYDAGIGKFLRAQYNLTQKYCKDHQITGLLLFRGGGLGGRQLGVDGVKSLFQNPLSSWSTSIQSAWPFAKKDARHYLFARWIPAEDLLSNPLTGFGCYDENEWVTLGRRAEPTWFINGRALTRRADRLGVGATIEDGVNKVWDQL